MNVVNLVKITKIIFKLNNTFLNVKFLLGDCLTPILTVVNPVYFT